jgi:hypothetical protein
MWLRLPGHCYYRAREKSFYSTQDEPSGLLWPSSIRTTNHASGAPEQLWRRRQHMNRRRAVGSRQPPQQTLFRRGGADPSHTFRALAILDGSLN